MHLMHREDDSHWVMDLNELGNPLRDLHTGVRAYTNYNQGALPSNATEEGFFACSRYKSSMLGSSNFCSGMESG